jgi:3-hydroxybutyryl-CoA dehydratase
MSDQPSNPAAAFRAQEWLGKSARRTCTITAQLVDRFVEVSGDSSPLHVDDDAARARGYRGRVVHGMLLGSLVSSVIGTQLPGEFGVLQEIQFSFRSPCYIGDEITIDVMVSEFHEALQLLSCKVEVRNRAGALLAKGQFRSGLVGAGGAPASGGD